MARLAWFSPVPPVPTGVAACTADAVGALGNAHAIDVFVDEPVVRQARGTLSAHEFVWRHQQQPYDLTVYQLGNSSHHDYEWPYLFRYPGLTVLHDAHLHHARAAALLRTSRAGDYRIEFAVNHPDRSPDLAELAVAGFDNHLLYDWPMTRLVVQASRLTAVHGEPLARRLRDEIPGAEIRAIRLGQGEWLTMEAAADRGRRARERHGIPADAMVFGCYGGLSPDKRVPQVLAAFAATLPYVPNAHLMLAGAAARHYDVAADIARRGLHDRVTLTGYVSTDEAFTDAIAACDVALTLRWPTAREISGPWLRCLAAGKPSVIIDLAHLGDVPTLDPRTWQPNLPPPRSTEPPCAISIDIVDEDHSLRLAMRRLGTDAQLRASLGDAARRYWQAAHSIEAMADDYETLIADAVRRPSSNVSLPAHLRADGRATLDRLLAPFGVASPLQ